MKKGLAFTAAVAVLACVIALLSGCGSDQSKAKDYMKKGDSILSSLQKDSTDIANKIQTLFNDSFSETGQPDAAKFKAGVATIKSLDSNLLKQATNAKAEYQKINSLKGVPDYAAYAALLVQVLDLQEKGIKEVNNFLDQTVTMVSAPTFDPAAFSDLTMKEGQSIQKLGDEADQKLQQSETLKKDKKL